MLKLDEKTYMDNLSQLKLVALMLVVIGHCSNQYKGGWVFISENSSEIFKWVSIYVNSFHMQIFVFISGSVYGYCKLRKMYYLNYCNLIIDKFRKLLIPYIFIGIFFMIPIGIKLGISDYNNGLKHSIKNLFLGYSSGHLWFLMMLFNLFMIYYWLEKILFRLGIPISIIILFVIQVYNFKFPHIFYIYKAMYYMIFFYLGHIIYLKYEVLRSIEYKTSRYNSIVAIFIGIIISLLILSKERILYKNIESIILCNGIENLIGILGIMQMYIAVEVIKNLKIYNKIKSYTNYINKYNFNIYLLHEPIIFIILYNILNMEPVLVVLSSFILSITMSILISNLYYDTIRNIKKYKFNRTYINIKSKLFRA